MTNDDLVLDAYRELPMQNGDVLLLLTDFKVANEFEGLADRWDPRIRRDLAAMLVTLGATELRLAIARPDAELLPQDHAMWADLREELLSSSVQVHPLVALPAAA